MNTKLDFINGNTKKCLLAMTLPMIVAMFLNMAYNFVDSLCIGNLLGETAYAALTNSTPIVLLLTSVAMGATNGISILLSQAIGARNEQKKMKLISTSFCIAIIFSLFITLILELFLPVILAALNTPAEIMNMARDYLSIYILGYLAVYLYLYFTAVLRSFGNTMFQVIAMLISTILNIIGLLDKATSGDVILFGQKNIRPFSMKAEQMLKNKIGYLFQNFALILSIQSPLLIQTPH